MADNKRVLFMGRKQVAARCLQWLLDRGDVEIVAVLTDSHLEVSPTSEVARSNDLPLLRFDDAMRAMENGELTFDLGVSMLYWRKLKGPFLSLPKSGVINFHPAPLPDFKGTAGYNMAILNQMDKWAATAHYVDEEIDTGRIITVDWFPIARDTVTIRELELRTADSLEQVFHSVIGQALISDELLPSSENAGGIYISRDEMEAMKEIKDGDNIDLKIRAFWYPPYPGAYIKKDGKKYTLVNQDLLNTLADPSVSSLFTNKSSKT